MTVFTHVDKGHLEGSLPQNFDLGPTFEFTQSRKKLSKNDKKLAVFCHKMTTKGQLKNLGRASLEKNLDNTQRIV